VAYNAKRTEHAGPKRRRGAFYGRKRDAKAHSNRRRRDNDKAESRVHFGHEGPVAPHRLANVEAAGRLR